MISLFSLICPLCIFDNESFNVFNHRKFETKCCNCYVQKLFYPMYWSFTVLNFFEDFKDRAAFTLMISYAISLPDHAWQYLQLVFQPFLCIKKLLRFVEKGCYCMEMYHTLAYEVQSWICWFHCLYLVKFWRLKYKECWFCCGFP